ncbi:hypothetical protein [Streptomyces roseifaciens]|uniref:hypothetical protein n=1 Tax=Streptomyces roseifaciens TaxID=1488406 RepID=UPI000718107A|nr:hypothetical protein [Streptomyces roseifaciens]
MTLPTPESRLEQATALLSQVIDVVYREGNRRYSAPYLMLQDIRDVLTRQEGGAETALKDAAEMFPMLYSAPRDGFSEFHVTQCDPDQRAEENRKFSAMVDDLRAALYG